ncbi:ATP-binding cassette sub-family C member 3 [Halotydeus destructor]|nr:ATP-binding cassette sub-family C member 3 [Halotydeus destructor]
MNAPFLSLLTFSWFDDLVKKGYKKPLDTEDMYDLTRENKSAEVSERFLAKWSYPGNAKISKPLLTTFYLPLAGTAVLQLTATCLTFVSPAVLDQFLVWMAGSEPRWRGYVYVFIMFVASTAESLLKNRSQYISSSVATQMKAAIVSTMHRKALRLSPSAKTRYSTGKIVNLIAVDTQRIVDVISTLSGFFVTPLQIALAIGLLWQQLGISTLAGVALMVAYMPANNYISTKFKSCKRSSLASRA